MDATPTVAEREAAAACRIFRLLHLATPRGRA